VSGHPGSSREKAELTILIRKGGGNQKTHALRSNATAAPVSASLSELQVKAAELMELANHPHKGQRRFRLVKCKKYLT
jgi:hypothetical protein